MRYLGVMIVMTMGVLLYTPASLAMTDEMCSQNKKCIECRDEKWCQKCYFKCSNKHGQVEGDIRFLYRLETKDLRALHCYKSCWDEGLEEELAERLEAEKDAKRSGKHDGKNREFRKAR